MSLEISSLNWSIDVAGYMLQLFRCDFVFWYAPGIVIGGVRMQRRQAAGKHRAARNCNVFQLLI